jgi:hypothetical protein
MAINVDKMAINVDKMASTLKWQWQQHWNFSETGVNKHNFGHIMASRLAAIRQ